MVTIVGTQGSLFRDGDGTLVTEILVFTVLSHGRIGCIHVELSKRTRRQTKSKSERSAQKHTNLSSTHSCDVSCVLVCSHTCLTATGDNNRREKK